MPLTYVLAAKAGVAAAAVAAAVARPTKRRLVASDMSTPVAVAIIAANRVRRIVAAKRVQPDCCALRPKSASFS